MGLLDRIKLAKAALFGNEPETTETGPKSDRVLQFTAPWGRFYQRKALWRDLELMDKDDAIIARGLDFISRVSTQFVEGEKPTGFLVNAPENEETLLAPLVRSLQRESFEFVRYMVKQGDMFTEVVVDESMTVSQLKMFPYSYQIEKNTDEFGRLLNGDPKVAMDKRVSGFAAYDQLSDTGQLLAAFNKWQIIQFSFGNKQGLNYAEPHLGPAVSVAKRLRAIEDGLAVARLTRAYPRTVHKIPIPASVNKDEVAKKIKEYKEMAGTDTTVPYDTTSAEFKVASKEAPPAVDTAFFIPRFWLPDGKTVDGDVTSLEADNPNLQNLEDVYLLIRRLLAAIGVPADFLNLAVGQKSFIDKASPERREAFLYLCCAVQTAYQVGLQWALEFQLLLHGIPPWDAQFEIVMPQLNPNEADVAATIGLKRANTAVMWASIGVPKEIIGGQVLKMSPVEVDKWLASGGTDTPEGVDPEEAKDNWVEELRRSMVPGYGEGDIVLPDLSQIVTMKKPIATPGAGVTD